MSITLNFMRQNHVICKQNDFLRDERERLRWTNAIVRDRSGRSELTFNPLDSIARMAASRPCPLTNTSTSCIPCPVADSRSGLRGHTSSIRRTFAAALKTGCPRYRHETTLPDWSVIHTIVLLKVARCAPDHSKFLTTFFGSTPTSRRFLLLTSHRNSLQMVLMETRPAHVKQGVLIAYDSTARRRMSEREPISWLRRDDDHALARSDTTFGARIGAGTLSMRRQVATINIWRDRCHVRKALDVTLNLGGADHPRWSALRFHRGAV